MTYFNKTKFRIVTVALVVATSAAATTASAQGLGVPMPPNLDFPKKGAVEDRSGNCLLFICRAKPQVTKNSTKTKLGGKS